MNYSFVGDEDMKHLAGLTGLQRLDVQHTQVTDAGLKHLAGLPSLRELSASSNKITDAALTPLAEVPNLETLSVTDCKITGSGFKALSKLSKLKELRVSGNPVTDEHVLALKDIKGLKEVAFTGTKVSEEVALALKQARPDMRVRDVAGDEVALDKKPEPRPKPPPTEDISKVAPAFKLTAEDFHKEYEADKNAAAQKYKGKVIELSGEVQTVKRIDADRSMLLLKVEKSFFGVQCVTTEEQPWAKVAPGQQIKIKGKWPEFSAGAAIIDCVFVETGEYAAIRISAADLAKEYAADGEAAVKKYDKKYLVITGEVVSKEFNSVGAGAVVLKTGNKVKVECSFTADEKDVVKAFKVGQSIKVVGQFTLNFASGDEVSVYFCLPLSGG